MSYPPLLESIIGTNQVPNKIEQETEKPLLAEYKMKLDVIEIRIHEMEEQLDVLK